MIAINIIYFSSDLNIHKVQKSFILLTDMWFIFIYALTNTHKPTATLIYIVKYIIQYIIINDMICIMWKQIHEQKWSKKIMAAK